MYLETQIQLVEWLKLPKLPVNEVENRINECATLNHLNTLYVLRVSKHKTNIGFSMDYLVQDHSMFTKYSD